MSQASIASFFTKKPAAAAATQSKDAVAEKTAKATAAMAVDDDSTPDTTPSLLKSESKKTDATPPTNTRKRLRPVDSSDSEDEKPGAPASKRADANEGDKAADEMPEDNTQDADKKERASSSPEKKQQASPAKKKEPVESASVKQFFTKKDPAAEKKQTATEKEAPAATKTKSEDTKKADTAKSEEKKEENKAEDAKAMTNMEKRKAEDKKLREEIKQEKAKSVGKGALGGGWGAVAVKSDAATKDAASDEEDAMDDDDEEVQYVFVRMCVCVCVILCHVFTQGKQELLKTASSFDASKEATWKKGEPVPYSHLANMFEKVEAITKRLEITAIVTKALRAVIETTPNDLLPCVYLCVNKLASAHEGVELGIGDMILKKALGEATGRQVLHVCMYVCM